MGLKKTLLSGIVAFVVATLAVRKVGGKRLATRVGLVTAVGVAVGTLLAGGDADVEAVEATAE